MEKLKRYQKNLLIALIVSTISAFLLPIFVDTAPYIVPYKAVSDEKVSRNKPIASLADKQSIYVTNHGWHTGIVLPASYLRDAIPEIATRFPYHEFIEIGWGDAGFYQNEDITIALTLNAIFTPSEAVLHLVGFNGNPMEVFANSEVNSISLTKPQFRNLTTFIFNSFMRDFNGGIIMKTVGRYGDSQFYSATGRYYLFNTCNKWTAKALASAGVPIRTEYKLTASSVTNYVKQATSLDENNMSKGGQE